MSRHRFFLLETLPLHAAAPAELPLTAADLHHAVRVLRLRAGEEIVVVEPEGAAWVVRLTAVTPDGLVGELVSREVAAPGAPRLTLYQGILKGSSMDEVIQHAVELGAERIVPLAASRTIVRLDDVKAHARVERWQRIAEGAARQSQRARIPVVSCVISIDDAAHQLAGFDAALVLWEESSGEGVVEALRARDLKAGSSVALIVGPEGGLAADEVAALVDAGAVECTLGRAILRAQTASLAAVTLASYALGGMGASA